tara:strand:+ start:850 stop:1131 length:282 start_codon:yes stop_codon:yes gene_type:complete
VELIQKYNYAELKKKEGASRLYLTPDGESLPSVTTVLSKTQDKSFLKEWKARVGEKKAEEIVANSSAIGTAATFIYRTFSEQTCIRRFNASGH